MKKWHKYSGGLVGLFLLAFCNTGFHQLPKINQIDQRNFLPLPLSCKTTHEYGPAVFSPNGRFVATFCTDVDYHPQRYTMDVWDVKEGGQSPVLTLHTQADRIHPVYAAAFSADGSELLVGTVDGPQLWKLPEARLLSLFENSPVAGADTSSVAFAETSRGRLLALFQKDTLYVLDRDQEKPLAILMYADATLSLSSLAFSPEGNHLLALTEPKRDHILVWNLDEPRPLRQVQVPLSNKVRNAMFVRAFENMHYIAFLIEGANSVFVWDDMNAISEEPSDPYKQKTFSRDALLSSVASSTDGAYFIVGQQGSSTKQPTISVSSAVVSSPGRPSFTVVANLDPPNSQILGASFSSDGNMLLAVTQAGLYQWALIRDQ